MKTHPIFLLTFILFLFISQCLKAQLPIIESLEIIPAYPTTNDTVKVISHSIFPSGGCPLTSSSITFNGATINVNVKHTLGMLTYICYSTDTITIGKLNAKSYDLIYTLALTSPPATYDIDTLHFTVQQPTGIPFIDNSDQIIDIFPNPIATEININLKTLSNDNYNVDIYSLLGQKIKSLRENKNTIRIDSSELTDGVYFIVITSENEKRWTKKIIKSTF